jgi:Fe-Mn family superoxide dismutase
MFKLPPLDYEYDALGKYISAELMMLHHSKHHQTYVDKLNLVIDSNPDLAGMSLDDLIKNHNNFSEAAKVGIRNHGGGHYNHTLFWQCMTPNGDGEPKGELAQLLNDKYGSFQGFVDEFTSKSLGVFGSGWAFLQPNGDIVTTPNQETPIGMGLESPILALDVWEHAYYIDYKNKRDDYVKAWWSVVDWDVVSKRYLDTVSN